ncbi:MAG: hypothetical protein ACOX64_09300 [Candidatus Merdivicinus sp.]|jgi:hypothetical protein
MDDLTSKVQEILGSEEGMKQIQDMAKALGLTGGDSVPAPASSGGGLDLSGLLAGLGSGQPSQPPPSQDGGFSLNPADLIKIQQLMQQMNTETPNTALLKSLRPLLKEERRHKVDEAIRIMHLLSLLPVLQQSGILKGLLGPAN